MVTMNSGAGCGLLLAFSSSRPLPTLALTASMASASLTVEQFEFLAGCLLLLFLLAAVHLAVPVSRFEYDKEEALAVRGVRRVPSSGMLGGRQSQQQQQQTREVRSNSIVNPQEHNEQQQQQQQQIICPSPPAIIRQGLTSGFIGDCGAGNAAAAAAAAAAADIPRDETKERSSIGGTAAATIIRHQDALPNDRAPSIGEEEEIEVGVEMTTQNEEEHDGEVGGELVLGGDEDSAAGVEEEVEEREGEDETEWRDDAIDLDDVTEGRDDHQDADSSNNSVTAEDSIEVRPNEKRSVLALVSEGVIDRVQSSNQRRALFLLDVRGVPYEKVDGMDPAQREVRDDLFELAGFGGDGGKPVSYTYPQFFFVGDGTVSYVGDFERLLSLNDASDIPGDILDQNPDLETWERVFVNLVDPSEIASP